MGLAQTGDVENSGDGSGVTRRRTVLEVCSYHGPYPGAFIPTIIAVGEGVREHLGLEYHCVFPSVMRHRPWVHSLEEAGIGITFLDSRSRTGSLRQLAHVAHSRRAALIRSHFSRWDVEAGLTARRAGAASVWHVHSGRFARELTPVLRLRDGVKVRVLGRLCDRVITVSDELHRVAAARGFPERKIQTVPNGIDVRRFEHLPGRAEARAGLGLGAAAPVVVGFAWSPHTKGADVLVAAARPLAASGKLILLLVGEEETLAPIIGSPPPAWVRIVEPRDDVETLYAAADVFVSASREEGFPYAIGEAMAAGLPVVSSDIPGPSAYFSAPGISTFPSEDAAALEAALRTVIDLNDREGLGAGNRAFVRDTLSLPAHVDRILTVFEELVSRAPSDR